MKRTALITILILTLPALCQGSVGPMPVLDTPKVEWNGYRLDLDDSMAADRSGSLELTPQSLSVILKGNTVSLDDALTYQAEVYSPRDMVSMVSYMWAELTGSMDVVAELTQFARQWRRGNRPARTAAAKGADHRNRWKIVVGCRIDDHLELAARFDTRGNLMNEKRVAWQLSAADLLPDNVGLTTVYRDGRFMVEADKVSISEAAMAKVVVRF